MAVQRLVYDDGSARPGTTWSVPRKFKERQTGAVIDRDTGEMKTHFVVSDGGAFDGIELREIVEVRHLLRYPRVVYRQRYLIGGRMTTWGPLKICTVEKFVDWGRKYGGQRGASLHAERQIKQPLHEKHRDHPDVVRLLKQIERGNAAGGADQPAAIAA